MLASPRVILVMTVIAAMTVACGESTESAANSAGAPGSGGALGGCALSCSLSTQFKPEDGSIDEASGLTASAAHQGVVYAHNDADDKPRFFAIGPNGSDLGTYNLTNATAIDWEDMALGPCADPSRRCIYIGDIGDNNKDREFYVVYRIEEPASLSGGSDDVTAEAFPFRYPDGSHDSEALFVEPMTGRVYVAIKDADKTKIYGFPDVLSEEMNVLERVGDANVPEEHPSVTAGDVHPNGNAILLRTDDSVWLYQVAPGGSIEDALATTPCKLPSAPEPQAESIAWRADGAGYFTMAEGDGEPVHSFACH